MASSRMLLAFICMSSLLSDCQSATAADSEIPDSEQALRWETELLRTHDIEPTAEGVLSYLDRLIPDEQTLKRADQLIEDLGAEDFIRRKKATRELLKIGDSVEARVQLAAESDNLEQGIRVRRILAAFQAARDSGLRSDLILAALRILKAEKSTRTPNVVLDLLPILTERHLIDAAKEAMWSNVEVQHAELIRSSLRYPQTAKQTAAIVALEVAVGADAVSELETSLASPQAEIRLAAARALLDRVPRQCLRTLGELVKSDDFEIHAHASCLLRDLSGQPIGADGTGDFSSVVEEWQKWLTTEGTSASLRTPVGPQRMDLSRALVVFRENFRAESALLVNGYGRFRYESTIPAKASVARNRLRFDGNHGEADQRLYVMSKELTGGREFPRQFSVATRMGGGAEGSGAYHVGLSVGRIKVLFHPGYSGGGFRVETTDDHDYLINNASMGFTPKANALYPIRLTVNRLENDRVEFEAEVRKPADAEQVYTKKFTLNAETVGPVNRIGLERSGRKGGDGMFENFEIDFAVRK